MAALFGVLFGLPSLRIKGFYLAVATLAAQFFVDWATARVKWLTNYAPSGSVSVNNLKALGIPINTPLSRYIFILCFVVVLALIAKNLVRGRIGRQWMAIRDMDIAAEIMGIRPVNAKLSAFAVSSFYIGIAGALFAFLRLGAWEPAAFSIDRSFIILFMIIIGGLGSILGSFLGAIYITLMPIFLNQLPGWLGLQLSTATIEHIAQMVFGVTIVVFLIVEPHGFARLWQIAKEKLQALAVPALRVCLQKKQRRRSSEERQTQGGESHETETSGIGGIGRRHRRHQRTRAGAERAVHSTARLSHGSVLAQWRAGRERHPRLLHARQ